LFSIRGTAWGKGRGQVRRKEKGKEEGGGKKRKGKELRGEWEE
jgi:hypothetical protein